MWYKFLIYFSLFAGAIINAIGGIMALTGAQYDGGADLVYALFSDLKTIDVIFGLGCIALAVLGIYVRMQLAAYRANGPKLLLVVYAGGAILSVFYIIGVMSVLGDMASNIDTTSTWAQIITSVVMIFINKVYFDKRAHMFTN